jgi:FMN phosphatase YigB (HAD superfamily)
MRLIVWDVDDVLNDLTRAWFEQAWLPAHPKCTLRYEALTENPPHRILGVTLEEYLELLDAFRLSVAGRELPPVDEVLAWFQKHGAEFHHVALTATPRFNAPDAAAWVMKHFGDWIRVFRFVPSPRKNRPLPVYEESKADCLCDMGQVDLFVDDNPANIAAAQALGIHTVTMPRPWNAARQSMTEVLRTLV